jgi:hypothetical protein
MPTSALKKTTASGKEPQRISDASVRAATGKGWDEWFRILDAQGAEQLGHKATARWLEQAQGVSDWWGQSIAIQHEWARGYRARATLRFAGRKVSGDLIADGPQVTFRSEGYSLGIPLVKVTSAKAKGGDLEVAFHRGTAVFAGLGKAAGAWARRFKV